MIDSEKILQQFIEVTAIPGVSRNERQIIDYLKQFIERLGFDFYEDNTSQNIKGNAGNLICKVTNSAKNAGSFLLAAHVDTITISCENPIVKNDRVISSDDRILGADDRVGVAILMEILNLIANKKIKYPNLEIVFLVSEEIGLLGSKNLDYSNISSKMGFNFDCSAPVGHVVVKAPTAIDFDIRFIGKEAHSAVAPEKGINAIQMASEAIGLFELPQKVDNTIFNIGRINGGKANNIIPGEVIITGELRSFDQEHIDNYWKKVTGCAESAVEKFGGSFKVNKPVRYKSFHLSENSTIFQIARTAIEKSNKKFVPINYLAGSDANIFNQKDITAINMGLGYANNHSCEEFITVADLLKNVEIGARIVQNAANLTG